MSWPYRRPPGNVPAGSRRWRAQERLVELLTAGGQVELCVVGDTENRRSVPSMVTAAGFARSIPGRLAKEMRWCGQRGGAGRELDRGHRGG